MPYADPERVREQKRQYYVANREKILSRHLQWYAANRDQQLPIKRQFYRRKWQESRTQVLDLLGGKCARCGFDDRRALQIDHINGGGTAEVRSLGTWGLMKKVLSDPTGYQLLCANCNWIKRYENVEQPRRRNES